MGIYLNPTSENFQNALNSEIYIDKTGIITFLNKKIHTLQSYLCVSRPRRFGKSMAMNMLAAYYGCGEDTSSLFNNLKIQKDSGFEKHLNKYYVIQLDMQSFMSSTNTVKELIKMVQRGLVKELNEEIGEELFSIDIPIWEMFSKVYQKKKRSFVILIDEWDCIMRRTYSDDEKRMYLDFLRNWLKDQPYIAMAYMTGILPIKKYGEHSTLNMFDEYSMIRSHQLVPYFGFTEKEVKELCERYDMDFDEAKEWYDGYHFVKGSGSKRVEYSMYSPKSVVDAMLNETYDNYWTQTETYEALKEWIQMDFDGLKNDVVEMLAGNAVEINARHFQNDMSVFHSKDDILTLLVHLGYLCYNSEEKTVYIPNKEVADEFVNTIESVPSYSEVFQAIQASKKLLQALWNMNEAVVAEGVQLAHEQFPAIHYNSENALSCVIQLAFYYAREYYTIIRELPTGTGYADICLIPKPHHMDKPAIIIELKWDKKVKTAINQIKEKNYPARLQVYQKNMLLCGITYDKEKDKTHKCVIEKM